jgi:prepilin-type N-terminal cleavage/methylation domain-containing protein/prepilin-type processing-associated H-X9-DG protein
VPSHEFSRRSAFSLIELLLVIAIMLLLTTLYWMPRKSDRQQQLKADCRKNLEKIYLGLEVYANDHARKFPNVPGARTSEEALDGLVPQYTSDTEVFICPGSKDPPLPSGESFLKRKISYSYYMGRFSTNGQVLMSDKQIDTLAKAPGQSVFSATGAPPGDNHHERGGNFLFCDGHLESSGANAPFPLDLGARVVLLNP